MRNVLPLFKGDICFFMELDTGSWNVRILICWNGDAQKLGRTDNRHLILVSWLVQGQNIRLGSRRLAAYWMALSTLERLHGELPSKEQLGREWVQSYSIRVWTPVFNWWFLGKGDQAAKPDQFLSFTSSGTPSLTEVWKVQHTPVTHRDNAY